MAKLKVEYTTELPDPSGWAIILAALILFGGIPAMSLLNQGMKSVQPNLVPVEASTD